MTYRQVFLFRFLLEQYNNSRRESVGSGKAWTHPRVGDIGVRGHRTECIIDDIHLIGGLKH